MECLGNLSFERTRCPDDRVRKEVEESTGLEIWKLIPWLNGYYAVSNRGRVRRAQPGTHTHSGRLLKPWKDKVGYLRIVLSTPLGNWSGLVHHLVLETFIGPRP